ncbi:hypothetical protein FQA39_LY00269 [Lamprigera yunnana]|nr:hypothetical protein FQA39_LY00269 [Lamprigera yunnana]
MDDRNQLDRENVKQRLQRLLFRYLTSSSSKFPAGSGSDWFSSLDPVADPHYVPFSSGEIVKNESKEGAAFEEETDQPNCDNPIPTTRKNVQSQPKRQQVDVRTNLENKDFGNVPDANLSGSESDANNLWITNQATEDLK